MPATKRWVDLDNKFHEDDNPFIIDFTAKQESLRFIVDNSAELAQYRTIAQQLLEKLDGIPKELMSQGKREQEKMQLLAERPSGYFESLRLPEPQGCWVLFQEVNEILETRNRWVDLDYVMHVKGADTITPLKPIMAKLQGIADDRSVRGDCTKTASRLLKRVRAMQSEFPSRSVVMCQLLMAYRAD